MLAGFPSIGNHNHAVALSAALETEGLLDAPADNQRVAELYHETVGVHLEALVAAKDMPGLVHTVIDLQRGKHEWTHGELLLKSETKARKFSEALQDRGLSEAPPGHWLVKALYCELFASDREKAIAKMKMPGLEVQVVNLQLQKYKWSHGEMFLTSKTDARKFSEALQHRGLLDARPGDARVSPPRGNQTSRAQSSPTCAQFICWFHRSRKRSTRSSSRHSSPKRRRKV